MKAKGLDSYFKRLKPTITQESQVEPQTEEIPQSTPQFHGSTSTPTTIQEEVEPFQVEVSSSLENIEPDPGKRVRLSDLTKDSVERENIRRAYLLKGPTQPILNEYPPTQKYGKVRRFSRHWYDEFGAWLEYSESKDACFCLYCYLYNMEFGNTQYGHDAFVGTGFRRWNKRDSLRGHIGDHNSVHNRCFKAGQDLMNRKKHIDIKLANVSVKSRQDYNTRFDATLLCIRYLLRNGQPFRGHDESQSSTRQGLFLETLKYGAKFNEEISKVILNNAPENHKLTSPDIQKDVANACGDLTVKAIIEDIGDDYFSILVDEARDVSTKEQMAVVIRYVNKKGLIMERFIGVVHVQDTTAQSLKLSIEGHFSKLGLSLSKCRGQGYDGASNMRGQFKGLKSLILAENPSAFYIHCFAHQLQLALVKASKNTTQIKGFFDMLQMLATLVGGSCKRQDILRVKQIEMIVERIAEGGTTGRGLNQERRVKRPGDTRWGSHYGTIVSVIALFPSIMHLLDIMSDDLSNDPAGTQAKMLKDVIKYFDFAFLLHLMRRILGISFDLSQALQKKDQDLATAIAQVKVVKDSLQMLRDDGFDEIMEETKEFCTKHDIDIPNMDEAYCPRGRPRRQAEKFTSYHYFKVDIFNRSIDAQLQEMNDRFDNVNTKLIECLICLDPRNSFATFDKKKLVEFARFYPSEFDEYGDLDFLSASLGNFVMDVRRDESFANLKGIGDLARMMVEKKKDIAYPMVYLLVKLALLLPVSTATVERVFSAMTYIKESLRNRIGEDWFNACMMTYIEYEIFDAVEDEEIKRYFQAMKPRRMLF